MKTFYRITQYVFKTYILLLTIFVISCGSRNSGSGYKSTSVSYYANKFDGKKTASGETYRHSKMTGAHKSLSFGTRVEIVNVENDKSVIITVNDRGPLKPSREFDLSQGAFKKIANLNAGIIKVKYRILK
ncbi:septal ring lytic transglycosylase RlpA family protein [Epilithonimonas zeae]|uniref:septal ring lytic transglycosylase RlpA family protein n=1 Tax=Epilithonimonas zeae TaxID=1416779 RepID=UPI00200F63D7|nr:septal ring lytic transglycosylase RlpA family protein [Epilithonimonas zeae]UQB67684.1 septal ring lytic transglycosylase RlpA family protein [Epilithonimonas zeae]